MNVKVTKENSAWLYTSGPISVRSEDGELPVKNGKPWIIFPNGRQINAVIAPLKTASSGMNRTVTAPTTINVTDLIPIHGCDVETLIRQIVEQQFIPLGDD